MITAILATSLVASSAPTIAATTESQSKLSLENSAIGFWQIGFADAGDFDIVALVRPTGAATVRINEEAATLYVVQPVLVVSSQDATSGQEIDVYYQIPRVPGSLRPTLNDLSPVEVELRDRTYLLVGLKQGTLVRFENEWVVGAGNRFTAPAINPERQTAIALGLFESDGVVWSDKEDRREWLLHTIVRTMPKMPDKGLRKASWLIARASWEPTRAGRTNRPSYDGQKESLYLATIEARSTLPPGRSAKAWLYMTFAIAGVQIFDPLDGKFHPGWAEMTKAVHRVVVQAREPLDDADVSRFCYLIVFAKLALEVAEQTDNQVLKVRALRAVDTLETRSERLVFLQLHSSMAPGVRYEGYVKLYKWLEITEPVIAVTKDRGKRVTSIDNELEVVAAIERKLG